MPKRARKRAKGKKPIEGQQDPTTGQFVAGNTICDNGSGPVNGVLGGRPPEEVKAYQNQLLMGLRDFHFTVKDGDGDPVEIVERMSAVDASFRTLLDIMQNSHSDEQRRLTAVGFLEMHFGKPKLAVDLHVTNDALDFVLEMAVKQKALAAINAEPST